MLFKMFHWKAFTLCRKFFSQMSMLYTYLLQSRCWKDLHNVPRDITMTSTFQGGQHFIRTRIWEHGAIFQDKLVLVQSGALQGIYITRDAHSSYKVNPNCALCIGQKTFSINFIVKSRDSSSITLFSVDTFIHDFPLQLVLETKTMTQ